MTRTGLLRSFPFLVSPRSKILILGSMPGERSLKERQYYAHPQNIFWDIMGDLFGADRQISYSERLRILNRHRVALWDVAFECRRNGSLDAAIRTESVVPNDFTSLFSLGPQIDTVFFNGHKAEQLFRSLVLKSQGLGKRPLRFLRLPSTSPAHATLTQAQKKARWRQGIQAALPQCFVYILQSAGNQYYTGYTTDLKRRMDQHRRGTGAKFTRGFGFKRLLYSETHPTKSAALKREAELKKWPRAMKKVLIANHRGIK